MVPLLTDYSSNLEISNPTSSWGLHVELFANLLLLLTIPLNQLPKFGGIMFRPSPEKPTFASFCSPVV